MKAVGLQLIDKINSVTDIDLKIDVKRDLNGQIIQGLVVGNILSQNQALILISQQGEFFMNPTLGVGINNLILDRDYLRFKHKIREEFTKDGLKIERLELSSETPLIIQASYE